MLHLALGSTVTEKGKGYPLVSRVPTFFSLSLLLVQSRPLIMVELNPFLGMIVITHDIGNKTYLWTESYVFFCVF